MKEFIPEGTKGTITTNNWSVEFDGQSVMDLMMTKPKMSYAEVLRIIINEGGYVDNGIIHKGTAINKVAVID